MSWEFINIIRVRSNSSKWFKNWHVLRLINLRFYITNLYIKLHNEKKGFTDKIHLSIVNESIGEEIHLILVQENDKDGEYVKRQLELKGKDIDILRVKEFYNLLS
jgi:hypothetical protein